MESDECHESISSPGAEEDIESKTNYSNLEAEKEFILKYESLPQLWDTSDKRYSKRYKRYQALTKLLPIYKKIKPYGTIEDIKKKINSLRSNYRREVKKYLSMDDGSYYPKVWYFPYLDFLRKSEEINVDVEIKNIPKLEESKKPEHINSEKTHIKKQRTHVKERPQGKKPLYSEVKPAELSAPKITKTILYREQIRNKLRPQPYPSQHNNYQMISNPLALEWSETLARLDPLQRLYAKKAINDVLFEAELGNLHKNSVQINESSSYYLRASSAEDDTEATPSTSIQIPDPISTKNNESTELDYKIPISLLHYNLENEQAPKETTEFGD